MQNNADIHPLQIFCNRLGYTFKRMELLNQAITHRSHSFFHNERLEFLGDAVLNCIVANMLYQRFPDLQEGHLSRIRARFVNQQALSELALGLRINEVIRLGEGEIRSGGYTRPSILADAFEAIIGGIFLDSSFAQVEIVVTALYQPLMRIENIHIREKDPKTLLQELLQGKKFSPPEYAVVTTTGKAHEQTFQVECTVSGFDLRTLGKGTSRRSAEQEAAKQAYKTLSSLLQE